MMDSFIRSLDQSKLAELYSHWLVLWLGQIWELEERRIYASVVVFKNEDKNKDMFKVEISLLAVELNCIQVELRFIIFYNPV